MKLKITCDGAKRRFAASDWKSLRDIISRLFGEGVGVYLCNGREISNQNDFEEVDDGNLVSVEVKQQSKQPIVRSTSKLTTQQTTSSDKLSYMKTKLKGEQLSQTVQSAIKLTSQPLEDTNWDSTNSTSSSDSEECVTDVDIKMSSPLSEVSSGVPYQIVLSPRSKRLRQKARNNFSLKTDESTKATDQKRGLKNSNPSGDQKLISVSRQQESADDDVTPVGRSPTGSSTSFDQIINQNESSLRQQHSVDDDSDVDEPHHSITSRRQYIDSDDDDSSSYTSDITTEDDEEQIDCSVRTERLEYDYYSEDELSPQQEEQLRWGDDYEDEVAEQPTGRWCDDFDSEKDAASAADVEVTRPTARWADDFDDSEISSPSPREEVHQISESEQSIEELRPVDMKSAMRIRISTTSEVSSSKSNSEVPNPNTILCEDYNKDEVIRWLLRENAQLRELLQFRTDRENGSSSQPLPATKEWEETTEAENPFDDYSMAAYCNS